jgi:hypothetical protein
MTQNTLLANDYKVFPTVRLHDTRKLPLRVHHSLVLSRSLGFLLYQIHELVDKIGKTRLTVLYHNRSLADSILLK